MLSRDHSSAVGSRDRPRRTVKDVVAVGAQGHVRAALRLEELWNDLATDQIFSLLCAYPLSAFSDPQDADSFIEVCEAHTHVDTCSQELQATRSSTISPFGHCGLINNPPTTFVGFTRRVRVTPTLEAGIADRVWSMEALAGLMKGEGLHENKINLQP